jgi:hypothetical protein
MPALEGEDGCSKVLPKHWYPAASLHGFTTQKATTSIIFHLFEKTKSSPSFNCAPHNEGILGEGGITPRILDFGTRWR